MIQVRKGPTYSEDQMVRLSPCLKGCSVLLQDIASLAVEKKYTKTFLAAEARYFRATSLGFPLEISKYYLSTSGIKVNGK